MLVDARELAQKRRPKFSGESKAYAAARTSLLTKEILLRRNIEEVAALRRQLPTGPLVSAPYKFRDSNGTEVDLDGLFGTHTTLMIYFWMYGPERARPCPMCTNILGALNGNGADILQNIAFKVVGRSPLERQYAFAVERHWSHLQFVETLGDEFAKDIGGLAADNVEYPALLVFKREDRDVRLFWSAEFTGEMCDPGQDPRGAPDIASLWNVLDLTPSDSKRDWYPRLVY